MKPFYRTEPITGVIITMGGVNAILGGVNAIGSLMLMGLFAAGSAIGYRWLIMQQDKALAITDAERLYLAPVPESNRPPA